MPAMRAKPVPPKIFDLNLELKRERLFLSDYPRFMSGEFSYTNLKQIMVSYEFKTYREARCWFSTRLYQ